jgi:hypothetical protein
MPVRGASGEDWMGEGNIPLTTSKQRSPTNRKVAMLEKSFPWRFRSFLRPMTAAYCRKSKHA